jgi:hypothetical protein
MRFRVTLFTPNNRTHLKEVNVMAQQNSTLSEMNYLRCGFLVLTQTLEVVEKTQKCRSLAYFE